MYKTVITKNINKKLTKNKNQIMKQLEDIY